MRIWSTNARTAAMIGGCIPVKPKKKIDWGVYGLEEAKVTGGFFSDPLRDMTEYQFNLCESCLDALFKTFKIPVKETGY